METNPSAPSTPSTPAPTGGVRNTFLTVICILTFIGSGWDIIKSIRSYASADTVAAVAGDAMKSAETQMDQQNTPSFLKNLMSSVTEGLSADNIRESAILQLIGNLFTLFGAILMWNLRKIGFYLYILGILVLVAMPVVLGKLIGIIGGAFVGFIGIIFIVMYGVNLKHMNKQQA
jgi:hypothetical protein